MHCMNSVGARWEYDGRAPQETGNTLGAPRCTVGRGESSGRARRGIRWARAGEYGARAPGNTMRARWGTLWPRAGNTARTVTRPSGRGKRRPRAPGNAVDARRGIRSARAGEYSGRARRGMRWTVGARAGETAFLPGNTMRARQSKCSFIILRSKQGRREGTFPVGSCYGRCSHTLDARRGRRIQDTLYANMTPVQDPKQRSSFESISY